MGRKYGWTNQYIRSLSFYFMTIVSATFKLLIDISSVVPVGVNNILIE